MSKRCPEKESSKQPEVELKFAKYSLATMIRRAGIKRVGITSLQQLDIHILEEVWKFKTYYKTEKSVDNVIKKHYSHLHHKKFDKRCNYSGTLVEKDDKKYYKFKMKECLVLNRKKFREVCIENKLRGDLDYDLIQTIIEKEMRLLLVAAMYATVNCGRVTVYGRDIHTASHLKNFFLNDTHSEKTYA